ncbi:MAG TPA: DUF6644 family protein [Caulobacteraceae bacterium]|jgi:hypothetical protein|nr:DUF6644 family protein [Caulobacteraceae bacterium]
MDGFLNWVGHTPFSLMLQTQAWMIPTIQSIHILAVALVFTSAAVLDLRLLGVLNAQARLPALVHRFAPWIGWGVLLLAVTGLLNMVAEPTRALLNHWFQLKMLALAIVCALTWGLAAQIKTRPGAWDRAPLQAKVLAILSLALWAFIVTAGRWIAYT